MISGNRSLWTIVTAQIHEMRKYFTVGFTATCELTLRVFPNYRSSLRVGLRPVLVSMTTVA
ncbi:MAG: hypothetical protein KJO31_19060, partial [Gammaproteobacteria bacterium]|nr:hypothetical protein [Gammaproteobacteria bacterium]